MSTEPHPGKIANHDGPSEMTVLIVILSAFAIMFGSLYFFKDERFLTAGFGISILMMVCLFASMPSPER